MSTDSANEANVSTAAENEGKSTTMHIFHATGNEVKEIGRTYAFQDARWVALSGGGAAFSFYGKKAEVVVKGDNVAAGVTNHARIGIYVNGTRVIDDLVDEPLRMYTVFESDNEQNVTVNVIKLSESANSTVGIQEIRVDAVDGIKPVPANDRKIEFIGDSITAGYGIDDENQEHHFSTATEDVTKTYAYKTAQALQADYSIVAYSGHGIISGYTGNGEKEASLIVPDYYDKVGKSFGRFDGIVEVETLNWDFNRFVPDLIVINLGTNDDSYTKDDADKQAEYAGQYVEFLKKVRAYNADATILCTLGIMGDRLYPFVEQAVAGYTKETGDTNIAAMKFDVQSPADGYAADWHPTEATQTKAAKKLTAEIRKLMKW